MYRRRFSCDTNLLTRTGSGVRPSGGGRERIIFIRSGLFCCRNRIVLHPLQEAIDGVLSKGRIRPVISCERYSPRFQYGVGSNSQRRRQASKTGASVVNAINNSFSIVTGIIVNKCLYLKSVTRRRSLIRKLSPETYAGESEVWAV